MKGLWGKLKETVAGARLGQALSRTRDTLTQGVERALGGRSRLDEEALDALEEVLLGADVGVAATDRLLERLRERARGDGDAVPLPDLFAAEVAAILRQAEGGSAPEAAAKPRVVFLVGVNGTGKTTTLGKLARRYRSEGLGVMVAAADTFRAAAVEQLAIWAERAGAQVVTGTPGGDPAAVAFDAVSAAQARGLDVVLVDTAGRLQTKTNLMDELAKIGRAVKKRIPDAPHEVLLVLDGTTGQNALHQAREFTRVAGVTGIVLTKVDGTAKGGMVIAIAEELGIPVRFLGLGEGPDDLVPFDADAFAAALFARE
jgi:fused signal recognition particle receptor